MASKSKKRRRVFRASCILAALIIAGSSFAWFTSKDEVTNRLTASSDYGVSIVESFTPPKMWVPGQEVNKDVYAVNTGNIAAFVKEDVSGILNYTFETKVGVWDDKCLELSEVTKTAIDGVTTNEAGGFLAWTDAEGVALGEVASARQTEGEDTRWAPSKKGTYIFRRSIDHDLTNQNNEHPASDTFTYAGYYYVPNQVDDPQNPGSKIDSTTPGDGKYYKIVIGNDTYRAKETGEGEDKNYEFDIYASQADINGINDTTLTFNRDGTITGTPKIWYVKEKNTEDMQVSFVYEDASTAAGNVHGPRLVVEYGTAIGADGTYDAIADKARKSVDLINKRGQYYQDKAEYEQAIADYTYALKLAKARDELQQAADDMYDANAAVNAANDGTAAKLATAWTNLKNAAHTEADSLKEVLDDLNLTETFSEGKWGETQTLSPKELLKAAKATDDDKSVWEVLTADQDKPEAQQILDDVQANYENMQAIWAAIQEDIKDINDALDKYVDQTNPIYITPEKAKEYEAIVDTKLADLARQVDLYKKAYADLVGEWNETAGTHTASGLNIVDVSGVKASINAVYEKLTAASENDVKAKQNVFNEKVTEYVNAYNADEEAGDALATAEDDWAAAKAKYNSDVTAAKTEYEKLTHQTAGTPQPNTAVEYKDNSKILVRDFSARREEQTNLDPATTHEGASDPAYDPTLSEADGYINQTNFAHDFDYYRTLAVGDKTMPSGTGTRAVVVAPVGNILADGSVENLNSNEGWNEAQLKDAASANPTIKTLYDDLKKAEGSEALYVAAQKAYEDAVAAADATSTIKIYVNLADDYADYWQYAGDKDQTGTTPTNVASFYYKYILEPGETSHKLIDSVTLDKNVTANDYKNLTFDLDVALDSAQITYADDQRTITTEAVDANAEAFKLQVEEADKPLAFDQAFDWEDRSAASNPIYKVNGVEITLGGSVTIGENTYTYSYTDTNDNVYVSNSDSGKFYKQTGVDTVSDSEFVTVDKT